MAGSTGPGGGEPGAAGSLPRRYFDDLYGRAADGDPWQFRRSRYEAEKYRATLGRLPRPRYPTALEVGCSIGVFTRMLAGRVDDLLAVDISEAALAQARAACGDVGAVRFAAVDLLAAVPRGPFDLVLVSEVAYYWTPADFDRAIRGLVAELAPGGHLMLVHWRAAVPDYPQTGDEVHDRAGTLADALGLRRGGSWAEPLYRADLWERP